VRIGWSLAPVRHNDSSTFVLTVRFQERDVADLGDWSVVDCLSHGLIHSAMLVEQLLLEGYPIGEDLPNRR
jgi:hypothetical protein